VYATKFLVLFVRAGSNSWGLLSIPPNLVISLQYLKILCKRACVCVRARARVCVCVFLLRILRQQYKNSPYSAFTLHSAARYRSTCLKRPSVDCDVRCGLVAQRCVDASLSKCPQQSPAIFRRQWGDATDSWLTETLDRLFTISVSVRNADSWQYIRYNMFLICGAGTNLKVGVHVIFVVPLHFFWLYKYNYSFWWALPWWSVEFGLLFFSTHVFPLPCSAICKSGGRVPSALWSRRRCSWRIAFERVGLDGDSKGGRGLILRIASGGLRADINHAALGHYDTRLCDNHNLM